MDFVIVASVVVAGGKPAAPYRAGLGRCQAESKTRTLKPTTVLGDRPVRHVPCANIAEAPAGRGCWPR